MSRILNSAGLNPMLAYRMRLGAIHDLLALKSTGSAAEPQCEAQPQNWLG